MNVNSHAHGSLGVILQAPRPLRFNSAPIARRTLLSPSMERARAANKEHEDRIIPSPTPDREWPSRASSRSSMSGSEALEEFLQILRPSSFLPPSSPVYTRRQSAPNPHGIFSHDRSHMNWSRLDLAQHTTETNTIDEITDLRAMQLSRNSGVQTPEVLNWHVQQPDGADTFDYHSHSNRWFSGHVLSSPVSRPRNPWARHDAHSTLSPVMGTPSESHSASPASVPLPLPTADETLTIDMAY